MIKLIDNKGNVVLEGENRKHIMLQILIFFECNNYELDFENNTFKLSCLFYTSPSPRDAHEYPMPA